VACDAQHAGPYAAPVARVHILSDDLLFGSRLRAELETAGHAVSLGLEPAAGAELVVVDLTVDAEERIDSLPRLPALAYYAHVESEVRELASARGIDLAVPRSRIAREAPALVERVLATAR
jgi:hypothetical protein